MGLALMGMTLGSFTGCTLLRGGGLASPTDEEGRAAPRYVDVFDDILIPGELSENNRKTYVVQANDTAAGILAFSGRVDRSSLILFFKEKMRDDGWQPLGSLTSSRTILLFQKQNRYCVINITEGDFSTDVEVGVVPTVPGSTP